MTTKHSVSRWACMLVVGGALIGLASASQAQVTYSLSGGVQGAIGSLQVPVQPQSGATGPTFPNLLIQMKPTATAMGTAASPNGALTITRHVASLPGAVRASGVANVNPNLYSVATSISFQWPNTNGGRTAMFGPQPSLPSVQTYSRFTTQLVNPSRVIYVRNPAKFGGSAQTSVTGMGPVPPPPGPAPDGSLDPVTGPGAVKIYARIPGGGVPPCRHPALGGDPNSANDAACIAAVAVGVPGPTGAGGATPNAAPYITPGGIGQTVAGGTMVSVTQGTQMVKIPITALPNGVAGGGLMLVNAPTTKGRIATAIQTPGLAMRVGFTNMATDVGFPGTTGQIILSAPDADNGAGETFTITGANNRTANGGGQLNMVTASVGLRPSGPNASRGWVTLNLPEPTAIAGAAGALLMLAGCHSLARRRNR